MSRRRERIATPDDDFLDLDWFAIEGRSVDAERAPLVLMLHGLGGATTATYMGVLARALAERGVASVGLNFRGCSEEVNRRPRLYHAGEFADVLHVLATLASRRAGRPLAVAGFSLGGNVLLRWLGEAGEAARGLVRAAAACSVPFDLAAGSAFVETGLRRVYLRHLLATLRVKLAAKRAQVAGLIDLERALRARTFRELDDAATAPLHGFRDADDYYARCSSAPWLRGVRVPTLVVHAEDDPFLPSAAIPRAALAANGAITPALVRHGGHLGFVHGSLARPRFFAEESMAAFLARGLLAAS